MNDAVSIFFINVYWHQKYSMRKPPVLHGQESMTYATGLLCILDKDKFYVISPIAKSILSQQSITSSKAAICCSAKSSSDSFEVIVLMQDCIFAMWSKDNPFKASCSHSLLYKQNETVQNIYDFFLRILSIHTFIISKNGNNSNKYKKDALEKLNY